MLLLLKQTVSHGASTPPRQNFGLVCLAAQQVNPAFRSQGYPSKGYRKTMHGLCPFFSSFRRGWGVWHVC